MTEVNIHKDYPKTCDRHDYWGQIKRTVNGKAVSEADIEMIVSAVYNGLKLQDKYDKLLDLGCGNAALASYFYPHLLQYIGVDFSDYLIEIAQENFKHDKVKAFTVNDILGYLNQDQAPKEVTKVLCYGVMSYLSKTDIKEALKLLYEKYENVERVYLGNIPQRDKAKEFFSQRNIKNFELDNCHSPIGVWWDARELSDLAKQIGWKTESKKMPNSFYATKYRFDLILTR
ncbi:hypothetical protein AAOGI_02140 [Agarivorans albus]